MQIGESTAEAVMGVLQIFCPQEGQITKGLVARGAHRHAPDGGHPGAVGRPGVSFVDGVTGGNVFVMTDPGRAPAGRGDDGRGRCPRTTTAS